MDGFGGLHGQDFQQTKPQPMTRAALMDEFKKADKSGPPPWRYTAAHATEDKIMIIENAYEEAFNDVVQTHGEGARKDIEQIWGAYKDMIALVCE